MRDEKIKYIDKLINDLKVVDYMEHDVVCATSFIKIKSGNYKLNNGETIERERVTKRNGYMNAVVICAVTLDKDIAMVVQPRVFLPGDKKVTIEMPAGYLNKDERVLDAAARELLEETGYVGDKFYLVDSYYPSLGYSGESISIVLATGCKKEKEQDLDSDEYINYFTANIEEIRWMIKNKYIVDATTKLAFYEVIDYLKNNNMLDIIEVND